MKEINLRDYYPHYATDRFVEVPDEVFAILEDFKRQEESYQRSLRRYKAFYSLDADTGIEKGILLEQPSPFELLEQQRMIALLYQGLATLPEKHHDRYLQPLLEKLGQNGGQDAGKHLRAAG